MCPRLERSPSLAFSLGIDSHVRALAHISSVGHNRTPHKQWWGSLVPKRDIGLLCPREESNLDYKIRNLASYPLNDKGYLLTSTIIHSFAEKSKSDDVGNDIRERLLKFHFLEF